MHLQYRHHNQFLGHPSTARAGEDVQVDFRAKMEFFEYVPFVWKTPCHAWFDRSLSTDHRILSKRTPKVNRITLDSLSAVAGSTEVLPVDLVSRRRMIIVTPNLPITKGPLMVWWHRKGAIPPRTLPLR